jgi:pyruvate dehydrogenase E1 component alpha subunit/2-oxoisovalerate dehydrogenase E1 component alpha subunit
MSPTELLSVIPGGPPSTQVDAPDIDRELLRKLYVGMLRVRVLDERMLALQRQGRIGFYGTARGEEAAVIGSAAAFRNEDWFVPALRQGGGMMWRGMTVEEVIAQGIGNSKDRLKGRQMPCHMAAREFNVVSWSSVIATQIVHAAGIARAMQLRNADTVVAGYMGDGATSENDFHTGLNFAGVWKAPVVFICQNNQWAISVAGSKQTASESYAVKAKAYGMPGVLVDGNDVLAVYQATKEAAERARNGGGPTLVEALTYRLGGHSSSDDPTRYRDAGEVEQWQRRDPIARFRAWLEERGHWSQDDEDSTHAAFEAEIREAIQANERTPPPPIATLFDDVYAEFPAHLIAQRAEMLSLRDKA